ncbi:MAG: DUF2177 family protein [Polynucleobacter sp.]|jgi:uncharacterized membrane protein|nr:DUF2177 family protein [Polynucleobacter sp.]
MQKFLISYFSLLISLLVIDLVWLMIIAKNMYRSDMGDLMASEPRLGAALAFYLLYALGATIFVVVPALTKQSWLHALQFGALFGFFCYMTYDLTNLAIIRNFPEKLAYIDIAWGALVTAICCCLAYGITNWFDKS